MEYPSTVDLRCTNPFIIDVPAHAPPSSELYVTTNATARVEETAKSPEKCAIPGCLSRCCRTTYRLPTALIYVCSWLFCLATA